jgi:hypothetical protein
MTCSYHLPVCLIDLLAFSMTMIVYQGPESYNQSLYEESSISATSSTPRSYAGLVSSLRRNRIAGMKQSAYWDTYLYSAIKELLAI